MVSLLALMLQLTGSAWHARVAAYAADRDQPGLIVLCTSQGMRVVRLGTDQQPEPVSPPTDDALRCSLCALASGLKLGLASPKPLLRVGEAATGHLKPKPTLLALASVTARPRNRGPPHPATA